MKKLLFTLCGILALVSCSSAIKVTEENKQINNFTFHNGAVTWSNIFEAQDSAAVKEWILTNFKITDDNGKRMGMTRYSTRILRSS